MLYSKRNHMNLKLFTLPWCDLYSPMNLLVRYLTTRADFPTCLSPKTSSFTMMSDPEQLHNLHGKLSLPAPTPLLAELLPRLGDGGLDGLSLSLSHLALLPDSASVSAFAVQGAPDEI